MSIPNETTTSAPPEPKSEAAPLPPLKPIALRTFVDVGVLTLLSTIGVIGFSTSFAQYNWLLAGIGGLLVGTGVAIGSYYLRLGVLTTALLAVIGFFLFGSAFALPNAAFLHFLPSLDALAGLTIGSVYGWADLLTLRAPVSLPEYVTAVPYLATWFIGLIVTLLAVRWLPRRRRTAWRAGILLIGPLVLYIAGVLLGTDEPFFAAIRGISFAAVALVWLGWRRGAQLGLQGNKTLFRKKIVGTAILVVAASIVGAFVGGAIAPPPDNRFVLREEVQPPFEPLTYPSPFAAYRKYTKTLEKTNLFTVDGLQPDQRLRLATLDTYDGILWGVAGSEVASAGSGSFSLVGKNIPEPTLFTPGATSDLTVTVDAYDDVWIPDIGYPSALDFVGPVADDQAAAMRYNPATATAVLTTGLTEGDTYTVASEIQKVVETDDLLEVPTAAIELPPVSNIPDIITSKAKEFAGDAATPIETLRNIELELQSTGFLSHGAADDPVTSRAGQGADRMIELFTRNQLIGDEEQYTSAFALMARSFGYPSRVVMGFAPTVPTGGGEVTITGADVTAWVEVAFEGVGWVSFYPTPDETDIPQDQTPKPQSEPQPQVRQPPRTENEQNDLVAGVEIDDSDKDDAELFIIPTWVYITGFSLLALLAIIFVPIIIVALLKARRRKKRRAARGDMSAAGAWDEMLDQFSELGYEIPANQTRRGTARELEGQVVTATPIALVGLADTTDAAVFSGTDIDDERTNVVWTEAMASAEAARAAVSGMRRILSRYRMSAARRWARKLVTTAEAEVGSTAKAPKAPKAPNAPKAPKDPQAAASPQQPTATPDAPEES